MFRKIFLSVLLFSMAVYACPAKAYTTLGRPTGYVNDFAGVLNVEQKGALESKLSKFEKESSNEITVVTIKDLGGDTIENYALKLFEEWGIGKTKRDNGVLLLIAIDDRQMRIEVGYGLEGALTDIQSNSIITNTLRPSFRAGDYFGGIDKAIDDIWAATRGEYMPSEQIPTQGALEIYFKVFIYIIAGVIWITSILARSKSWWAGGVLGGIAGVIISSIFGFFYVGILSLVVFVPLGLLLDFFVSRAYQRGVSTGHYPWWIGGGPHGGGSGWGGGGFGGFGGGRSGGGGSSGSW